MLSQLKMLNNPKEKYLTFRHLAVLLSIALCIGIYLICTTVLVATDSTSYIEYAKGLGDETAIETIKSQDQHPGYPAMILAMNKLVRVFRPGNDIFTWIYSAQIVTLLSRLLAIPVLYFLGKRFVGAQQSFLAILILILLPKLAEYGSDALSDWPHMFVLSLAILVLMHAANTKRILLYGIVGLLAGIGYLIRPESIQVVLYAGFWLLFQLFVEKKTVYRIKTCFCGVLVLVCFAVVVFPYMNLKGAIFPKKKILNFANASESSADLAHSLEANMSYAGSPRQFKAVGKIISNLNKTLMWIFFPPLLTGLFYYLKKRQWLKPEYFIIFVFVVLYVFLMIWLYCRSNYMSTRHTMPLVVMTIFFVPAGLKAISEWLERIWPNRKNWFAILIIAGFCICVPKLLIPIRIEKKTYRKAAEWIAVNTDPEDKVCLVESRLAFYAERGYLAGFREPYFEQVKYVVQVIKHSEEELSYKQLEKFKSWPTVNKSKEGKVLVYRVVSVNSGSLAEY